MQKLTVARYIPENSTAVTRENCDAIAYVYDRNGKPCAVGYAGRKKRPAFSFYFQNDEKRDEHVNNFLDEHEKISVERRERREAQRNFKTTLKPGDVLSGCWGYEQTNREFYEVIAVKSGKTIVIRQLAKEKTYSDSGMSGHAVPIPGNYTSSASTARVATGDYVSTTIVVTKVLLSKWDGKPGYFSEYA